MRKAITILFSLLLTLSADAQQAVQYSQFMLNDYGLNPAVAGSNNGLMIMMGRRTQWRGFDLAPETNFASVTKDFGKKGYRYYWHGLGAYVEQDKFGLFTNKSAYGSYAIHLKLSSKYYFSFGIAAGIKSVAITDSFIDIADPALTMQNQKVVIPDIIPGLYLYSKKLSLGLSIRNIYKNSLKQGSKEIGTKGRLQPTAVFMVSRKYRSAGYDYVFVPGINIQSNFIGIPSAQFNFMAYFRQRIGLGLSYRAHDAVSAIVQIRVFKNVVVGFAYDYTVSRFRSANANSTEIMMGITPVMSSQGYDTPNGAADCPKFDFDF